LKIAPGSGRVAFTFCEKKDMAAGDTEQAPVPLNRELTKWEEWRGVLFFAIVVITSGIVIWNIPVLHPIAPLILLGIGLFFDLISLVARISTAITGKYSSGFFLVGFIFYFWAWISYPHAVLLGESDGLLSLWLRKLPDILCLAVLHLLIHVTYGRDGEEPETERAEQAGGHQPPTRPDST
jgi:hypothetical protein